MNHTYAGFAIAVLIVVVGAVWYTRSPEEPGTIHGTVAEGSYAYTCNNNISFVMTPAADLSSIKIEPVTGMSYPPASVLADSPTESGRRFRGTDFEFHGLGESVTLYAAREGVTYSCTPQPKPNQPPFNWGGEGVEPISGSSVSVKARVGVPVQALGETITIRKVLEDSRCPADVQCIQAGTMRLDALVRGGMGDGQITLELGKTGTTEVNAFRFVSATPARTSGEEIAEADYEFTLEVTRRD